MSLTQSLLPVVALMAPSAVSATEGKGESSSEKRVGKCPNDSQGYYEAGLWIRIRMDLHSFYLLDPDPGRQIFQIKTEKGKEMAINGNFIQYLKYICTKLHCFLL